MNAGPALEAVREKRLATLKARCALAGISLWVTRSDHGSEAYLLTRGPMTIELQTLDEIEERLDEAGAH